MNIDQQTRAPEDRTSDFALRLRREQRRFEERSRAVDAWREAFDRWAAAKKKTGRAFDLGVIWWLFAALFDRTGGGKLLWMTIGLGAVASTAFVWHLVQSFRLYGPMERAEKEHERIVAEQDGADAP